MKSTVFSANLSLKIPRNLTFFLRPIRGTVLWTVYVSSSWSGHLFLTLSPHFFPSRTPVMSNLDQSYFKRSERLHTLEAWKSGLNVWPSFCPDKSYFWLDIVRWLVVITSPDVGVPSWSYGSWALCWVPWVLQVHSTRLGPLQFLLEHSLGFTTIYSLKCQLSPPHNQRPQQLRGVETAKISEYVIHKLAGKFRMGSKFFVLYIICNYGILIYSLVSLEASTCRYYFS